MAQSHVTLNVGGMTCDSCVRAIERKLSKVAGVSRAQVSLADSRATIDYDDSRSTPEQMVATVEQLGYTAQRT